MAQRANEKTGTANGFAGDNSGGRDSADAGTAAGFDPAVEFLKCTADPGYFCDSYCVIDDAQDLGEGSGRMRFRLWPDQVKMMHLLLQVRLLILLKARQLGMSWVCCAYALWMCFFQDGKLVLVFSKGQVEADVMVSRILKLYKRLPEFLREAGPQLVKETVARLEWSNGSSVQSLPATKNAGSGFTASLVILDEFAKMEWADSLYTAVKPTIDGGGQLVILSTAFGVGNIFHTLWVASEAKLNDYYAYFLSWRSRPDRTQAWFENMVRNHPNPDEIPQEYPQTAEEAFLASGRPRFYRDWLVAQRKNICPPVLNTSKPAGFVPAELLSIPNLQIYRFPEPGRKYLIAGDPSQGTVTSDPSPATVIDADTWEEVALLHGRFEPTTFGQMLVRLAFYYNAAWVSVARNNHGHAVLAEMVGLGYPALFWGPDKQLGWPENVKSKPRMIDDLADALKEGAITIHSQAALSEMFIYRIQDNGKTSAPSGKTDDLVTTWALLMACAKMPKPEMGSFMPQAHVQGRTFTVNAAPGSNGYPNRHTGMINTPALPPGASFLPGGKR